MFRKIGIMIGSFSDLPQCRRGLEYLQRQVLAKRVSEDCPILINSIHRHTEIVLENMRTIQINDLDVLIIGAGLANHLTGTCEAYLRRHLFNTRTVVIGVAFTNRNDPATQAARLSITKVPSTQVFFDDFIGEEGFFRACVYAATQDLPRIVLPKSDALPMKLNLYEAIALAGKVT